MKKLIFSLCLLFANSSYSMANNTDHDNCFKSILAISKVSYSILPKTPGVTFSHDTFKRYCVAKDDQIISYKNIPLSYFYKNLQVFDGHPQDSYLENLALRSDTMTIRHYNFAQSGAKELTELIMLFVNDHK